MPMNSKIYKSVLVVVLIIFGFQFSEASRLHQEDGIYQHHSVEYVRTLNRNTSTDVDAAFYNPAGLVFMEEKEGMHMTLNLQTYYVKKIHTMDYYAIDTGSGPVKTQITQSWFRSNLPNEYTAELTAPCLPSFDMVWKGNRWSVYFDFSIMQAATNMTFPKGLAVMDWGNLASKEIEYASGATHLKEYLRESLAVRNEMYLGFTLGGAFKIFNWFSTGIGVRGIYAQGNMKIQVDNIRYVTNDGSGDTLTYPAENKWNVDVDTKGFGLGFIVSTHFKPSFIQGLDGSIRFEYYAPMPLKKVTNSFIVPTNLEASGSLDIFKDGTPGKQMTYTSPGGNGITDILVTYPMTLNFGLAYTILKKVKLEASAEISFRKDRDLSGRENDYGIGYRVGGAVEWLVTPSIRISAGYLFNDFGIKPEKRNEADMLLNFHQFGAGAGFKINENLDLNIGAFYVLFVPVKVYSTEVTNVGGSTTIHYLSKDLNESRFSIGIGITCRILMNSSEKGNSNDKTKTAKEEKKPAPDKKPDKNTGK